MEEFNELTRSLDFHSELTAVLSQKRSLYQFFSNFKKMFLPDPYCTDLLFLLHVVEGKKKLLSLEKITHTRGSLKDITINNNKLHEHCLHHPVLKDYVPDSPVNKEFMISLMSVLDTKTLDQLYEINNKRNESKNKNKGKESEIIKICPEFANILFSYPVIYKPAIFKIYPIGKISKKVNVKDEEKEVNDVLDPEKRKRISEGEDEEADNINYKADSEDEDDENDQDTHQGTKEHQLIKKNEKKRCQICKDRGFDSNTPYMCSVCHIFMHGKCFDHHLTML